MSSVGAAKVAVEASLLVALSSGGVCLGGASQAKRKGAVAYLSDETSDALANPCVPVRACVRLVLVWLVVCRLRCELTDDRGRRRDDDEDAK